MKNVFSGMVGVGGNEGISSKKLDPSLQSLFGIYTFYQGGRLDLLSKKETVV